MKDHDPELYREISKPFPSAEAASEAIDAFYDELYELRRKHKIPDVLVVMQVNGMTRDGQEGTMILSGMIGGAMYEESLAAYALGEASARRQEKIAAIIGGAKGIKKLPRKD